MMNIGAIIRKYREKENLTQKEFSADVDITSTYLSAIENGRKEPSLSLIKKICEILGTPSEVLFWDAFEVDDALQGDDKKIVEMAKIIIKNYYETVNKNCVKT